MESATVTVPRYPDNPALMHRFDAVIVVSTVFCNVSPHMLPLLIFAWVCGSVNLIAARAGHLFLGHASVPIACLALEYHHAGFVEQINQHVVSHRGEFNRSPFVVDEFKALEQRVTNFLIGCIRLECVINLGLQFVRFVTPCR